MTRQSRLWARILVFSFVLLPTVGATARAQADPRARRRVVVTRARPCPAPRRTATLGTFYPTPYITVGGSNPVGSGYSPLGIYGDPTLALYGPLSPLRTMTAPVLIYVRGYDGTIRVTEAASFSTPNLPEISPVIYPTEANNFYAPRIDRAPPRGSSVINWIDQN